METRASHVLVGAFAIAIVGLAFAGILWLGRLDRQQGRLYELVFEDRVVGLSVGSAVQFQGIPVGEVRRLALDPGDPRRVIAVIRIDPEVPVRQGVVAELQLQGITGQSIVQLVGARPDAPPLGAPPDGGLPRIPTRPSRLQQLVADAPTLLAQSNLVLSRLERLLDEENQQRIRSLLAHLEQASAGLARQEPRFDGLVADARTALREVSGAAGDLRRLSARLDGVAGRADRVFERDVPALIAELRRGAGSLDGVLARVDEVITENRAPLADFTGRGLGQFSLLVAEARQLVASLDRLIFRLESDPQGFLFGDDRREYRPE
ncbi:MAG: MlaD family protein [Acidobacteriota bacterium]